MTHMYAVMNGNITVFTIECESYEFQVIGEKRKIHFKKSDNHYVIVEWDESWSIINCGEIG
ncbi:MAG: hypothetical protein ACYTFW_01080 [Planctomycetota bacterium]